MKPTACLTTSWDDGHPLDLRLAELLAKYDLRGTFYVPRSAPHGTMTTEQIRELSSTFEVGAHTLHHEVLTGTRDERAWQEIAESKSWLEDVTGLTCNLFCPPQGKYSLRHLGLIRQAGYLGVRSVELLSLAFPRPSAGVLVLPTTIQSYPHGLLAYVKNAVRRAAFQSFWRYITHGRSTDWTKLAQALLCRVLEHGGVFHLWGHSWELEHTGQWRRLEEVLRFMSQFTSQAAALSNGQICQASLCSVDGAIG